MYKAILQCGTLYEEMYYLNETKKFKYGTLAYITTFKITLCNHAYAEKQTDSHDKLIISLSMLTVIRDPNISDFYKLQFLLH